MTYTWGFEVEARIRELYCVRGKALKDVMAIINTEFPGMDGAKERTYQKYLKKWGITKGLNPRSRQEPSRTYSNQQNLRSNARRSRRPRMPRQASLDATAISENTSSDENESSIASSVDPVGFHHHDPVLAEPTARILNTIPLPHNPHSTGLSFISPTTSNSFPEYNMGDSTAFLGQASIGAGCRVSNSMSTSETTGIRMYSDSDITLDTNLVPNPMSQMAIDRPDRPSLSLAERLAQSSELRASATVDGDIIPLEISLQALPIEDDKMLLFCSFVGGTNIALGILPRFLKCPQETINLSIEKLSSYGLVSQDAGNISIDVSVKDWLWIRNNRPVRLPFVQQMMIQVSNSLSLGRTPSKIDWDFARLSAPYFEELTDTILRFKDSGASIWNKETLWAAVVIADTARRLGKNKRSGMILENVLPILRDICGNDDPLTLNATNALSVVFMNLKNWRAAEGHLHTLIRIQEQFSDIKGCSYVTQLSNWARVLVQLDKHNDARVVLTTIAELGKRVDEPIEVLIHRLKLAETQRFCGDLKEAEGLLLQVMKDSRNILREDDLQTLRALELLCYVYSDQKSWAQAELNSSKLVKLSQKALGPSQPDTVRRVAFHEKIRRRRGKQRE